MARPLDDYSDCDMDTWDSAPLTAAVALQMATFAFLLVALVLALVGIAALVGPTPEVATWR